MDPVPDDAYNAADGRVHPGVRNSTRTPRTRSSRGWGYLTLGGRVFTFDNARPRRPGVARVPWAAYNQ